MVVVIVVFLFVLPRRLTKDNKCAIKKQGRTNQQILRLGDQHDLDIVYRISDLQLKPKKTSKFFSLSLSLLNIAQLNTT